MNDLAIIRSMTSKEGSHPRASFLLHHGYLPMGGVKFPTLGSQVAHQIGDPTFDLPSFVRIGGRRARRGRRRVSWASTTIRSCCRTPKRKPENTQPATRDERYARRLKLLDQSGSRFRRGRRRRHRRRPSQADPQIVRDDPQPADGGVRPEQGIGQDARRLRPHAVRRRLPAGAAAGRSGRHVRRSQPRRLGHARRQLQPRRRTATR